ncbi:MAG: PLDc N-terminal domain-containing protein [Chloroflexi bacterium]|nr:PLDc N-terminal domain-containing protein [Chloroflexota bacterium]
MDIVTALVLAAPIVLIFFGLQVWALLDLARRDKARVRGKSKTLWVALILASGPIGSLAYLLLARQE